MVETAQVKYVFLDIVGFTKDRNVEAQSEIIATLNHIVTHSLRRLDVPEEKIILLPTGDGIVIAMIDVREFDIHLQLALIILNYVYGHNSGTFDAMRKFEVRIGINENIDNILVDINGRRNVAGNGISMAQRIMDNADASQILVGSTVYEFLRQREQYFSSFRVFFAKVKHGGTLPVYQFLSIDSRGLSVTVPSVFAEKKIEPERLSKFVAYYIAHAVSNKSFLSSQITDINHNVAAVVLLYLLARDSEQASEALHRKPSKMTWNAGSASFEEQYAFYYEMDFSVIYELAHLLKVTSLQQYSDYFEDSDELSKSYLFVKPSGVQKIQTEWPQIANEFGIGQLQ